MVSSLIEIMVPWIWCRPLFSGLVFGGLVWWMKFRPNTGSSRLLHRGREWTVSAGPNWTERMWTRLDPSATGPIALPLCRSWLNAGACREVFRVNAARAPRLQLRLSSGHNKRVPTLAGQHQWLARGLGAGNEPLSGGPARGPEPWRDHGAMGMSGDLAKAIPRLGQKKGKPEACAGVMRWRMMWELGRWVRSGRNAPQLDRSGDCLR